MDSLRFRTPLFSKKSNYKFLNFFFLSLFLILTSCSGSTGPASENETDKDEPSEAISVTEEEAVDTLIEVIQNSGLSFPSREKLFKNNSVDFGLFAMDYIELDSSPNGLLQIKMWIGEEGNIIPKPSWQTANQDVCLEQGRYMKGAVKQLQFTILTTSQEVQLNYTDIETGKIEQSVIGTQNDDNDNEDSNNSNWFTESMSDAWNQMQNKVTINGTVGPCGEKIEMQIQFSSEITTDLTSDEEEPIVYFEHIQANFPLEFNEEKNAYTGTGDLEWISWEFNGNQGDDAPSGKQLEVIQLVTPKVDNPDYEDPALELELPGFEDGTPLINLSWPLIHTYERNESGDNYTYIFTEWEISTDESSTVMKKTFSRTENFTIEGDPVEIIENTSIEIIR